MQHETISLILTFFGFLGSNASLAAFSLTDKNKGVGLFLQ
jgi:hypothetical protein